MNLPRNLTIFALVLAVLCGGAAYMWFKGKPVSPSDNPLMFVNVEKITTIVIENQTSSTTLLQQNGKWMVSQPVEDMADPVSIDRLMAALKSFTVGSVVSENKANHPKLMVDVEHAGHVQVFSEGDKKVLDAYVGKTATGQSDSYIRFEGKDSVYIASDLPNYLFRRTAKNFRLAKLFSTPIAETTAVRIHKEKKQWSLVRSSDVWKNELDGKVVEAAWIEALMRKMDGLYAADFGSGQEPPAELGYDKPFLKVTVESTSAPATFTIGNMMPSASAMSMSYGGVRYASTEGRKAVMVVPSRLLDDFVSHLNSFK